MFTTSDQLDAITCVENLTNMHFILRYQAGNSSSYLLWKGPPNFASNVTLYPCERSRQNHLGTGTGLTFIAGLIFILKIDYFSVKISLKSFRKEVGDNSHENIKITIQSIKGASKG